MEHLYKFEVKHGELVGLPIPINILQYSSSKFPDTNDRMDLQYVVFPINAIIHYTEEMIFKEAKKMFDKGDW